MQNNNEVSPQVRLTEIAQLMTDAEAAFLLDCFSHLRQRKRGENYYFLKLEEHEIKGLAEHGYRALWCSDGLLDAKCVNAGLCDIATQLFEAYKAKDDPYKIKIA